MNARDFEIDFKKIRLLMWPCVMFGLLMACDGGESQEQAKARKLAELQERLGRACRSRVWK